MKEIFIRLTNESPSFFKRLQAIAITVGAVGTAIVTIPASVVVLPAAVTTLGGYLMACGIVAAAIAKTPVTDPSVLKKEESKND